MINFVMLTLYCGSMSFVGRTLLRMSLAMGVRRVTYNVRVLRYTSHDAHP